MDTGMGEQWMGEPWFKCGLQVKVNRGRSSVFAVAALMYPGKYIVIDSENKYQTARPSAGKPEKDTEMVTDSGAWHSPTFCTHDPDTMTKRKTKKTYRASEFLFQVPQTGTTAWFRLHEEEQPRRRGEWGKKRKPGKSSGRIDLALASTL